VKRGPALRILPAPSFGPLLFKLGLGLGLLLIAIPAGFWVGVRGLQVVGLIK
jgi:hypothetical protein